MLNGIVKYEIKQDIKVYIEDNDKGDVSPEILWDACKAVLRGKFIAKATQLKKIRQEKTKNL